MSLNIVNNGVVKDFFAYYPLIENKPCDTKVLVSNTSDSSFEEDICSRNYTLICDYKKYLESKDYGRALQTAVKISCLPVLDIAFKRIALGLINDSKAMEAILVAIKIIETFQREVIINNIILKATELKIELDPVLEMIMDLAIAHANKPVISIVIEHIKMFIPNEVERNDFLITCIKGMKLKNKYELAISILNYLSIGQETIDIEDSEDVEITMQYRKKAFNIIFRDLLILRNYSFVLKLIKEFIEISKTSTDSNILQNSFLYNPLLCDLIKDLVIDEKFDLVIEAVRLIYNKEMRWNQFISIISKFFEKDVKWQVDNNKIILLFVDQLAEAKNMDFIETIDVKLNTLCEMLIDKHFLHEAKEVIAHIRSKNFQDVLQEKVRNSMNKSAL